MRLYCMNFKIKNAANSCEVYYQSSWRLFFILKT